MMSIRSSSSGVLGPLVRSSPISIGSFSARLASAIAPSTLLPAPMPRMPGGHHPAPIPSTTSTTQSATEARGFSTAKRALFSDPPPLAETVTSTVVPATSSTCIMAGVLSRVLFRAPSGSATIEARSGFASCT